MRDGLAPTTPMSLQTLRLDRYDGIARLTLARPDVHNAFDDVLIAELTSTLESLALDPAVRVLVLTGAGASFSAGAARTRWIVLGSRGFATPRLG